MGERGTGGYQQRKKEKNGVEGGPAGGEGKKVEMMGPMPGKTNEGERGRRKGKRAVVEGGADGEVVRSSGLKAGGRIEKKIRLKKKEKKAERRAKAKIGEAKVGGGKTKIDGKI